MWTITRTKDDASWLDDYIQDVIAHAPPDLPLHDQKIGSVETHWHQIAPGQVYVAANPLQGTFEDRAFAERVIWSQLVPFGFKRAVYKKGFEVVAGSWGVSPQVEAKAKRLVQSGAVHLLTNSNAGTVAEVDGDTEGVHQVEIRRQDPNDPNKVTGAFCDCTWGKFLNQPRTRQWKKFQYIPCAHIVGTSWVSMSVPRDEARAPGNQGEEGQMSLPGMDQSGGEAPSSMGLMQQSPMANPNSWFTQPGAPQQGMGEQQMAPAPEDVLPQYPMAEQQEMPPVNPASIPGGRPGPTPTNPLQYPGGTFSSYDSARLWVMAAQAYNNGDVVNLKNHTKGIQVGRSEEHGAGQPMDIPAGRSGEVLGTDPVTGMVNVLFMDKEFDNNTIFEPFGATAWCWPSEIEPSRKRPPGPAIRRLR